MAAPTGWGWRLFNGDGQKEGLHGFVHPSDINFVSTACAYFGADSIHDAFTGPPLPGAGEPAHVRAPMVLPGDHCTMHE